MGWERKTLNWENQEVEWTGLGAELSLSGKEAVLGLVLHPWSEDGELDHLVWGQSHRGEKKITPPDQGGAKEDQTGLSQTLHSSGTSLLPQVCAVAS